VPDGVVKATSSPSEVVVPPRNATWKSALSTGPAASTQRMASAIGAPGCGAGDDVGEVLAGVEDAVPVVRDGVIGVSWVACGGFPDSWEHPATSTDAPNNSAIRITQG
jgi:hypothetical protein